MKTQTTHNKHVEWMEWVECKDEVLPHKVFLNYFTTVYLTDFAKAKVMRKARKEFIEAQKESVKK